MNKLFYVMFVVIGALLAITYLFYNPLLQYIDGTFYNWDPFHRQGMFHRATYSFIDAVRFNCCAFPFIVLYLLPSLHLKNNKKYMMFSYVFLFLALILIVINYVT